MIKLGEELITKENENCRVSVKLIGYVPEGYIVELYHYEKSINKQFSYTKINPCVNPAKLKRIRDPFKRVPGLKNYYCIGNTTIYTDLKSKRMYNKWRQLIDHDLVPDDRFMLFSNFEKWYNEECENIKYDDGSKPTPFIFSNTDLNKDTCILLPYRYVMILKELKENDMGFIIDERYHKKYRVHLYRNKGIQRYVFCYTKKFAMNLFYFKKYMNILGLIQELKNNYNIDTKIIEDFATDWYLNNSCLPDDGELVAGEKAEKEMYENEGRDTSKVDEYINL